MRWSKLVGLASAGLGLALLIGGCHSDGGGTLLAVLNATDRPIVLDLVMDGAQPPFVLRPHAYAGISAPWFNRRDGWTVVVRAPDCSIIASVPITMSTGWLDVGLNPSPTWHADYQELYATGATAQSAGTAAGCPASPQLPWPSPTA
jgi:hypothetical protein